MKIKLKILALALTISVFLSGCGITFTNKIDDQFYLFKDVSSYNSLDEIPQFDGKTSYIILNDNKPEFTDSEITQKSFEFYSPLDRLGRCGVVMACIGVDIMPTEERGAIGMIKPSGWHTVKYDCVDGKYLYNRCHLIGYQLTGENANEQNLITGTRFLNIEGMLPFEDLVADYVRKTKNHVLYRVTPIFKGDNLLASGVKMEGYSVEDNGKGISFNVYAYNAQPEIEIDYKTGESSSGLVDTAKPEVYRKYILNTSSKKIHLADCSFAKKIKSENRKTITEKNIDKLLQNGYSACEQCIP